MLCGCSHLRRDLCPAGRPSRASPARRGGGTAEGSGPLGPADRRGSALSALSRWPAGRGESVVRPSPGRLRHRTGRAGGNRRHTGGAHLTGHPASRHAYRGRAGTGADRFSARWHPHGPASGTGSRPTGTRTDRRLNELLVTGLLRATDGGLAFPHPRSSASAPGSSWPASAYRTWISPQEPPDRRGTAHTDAVG